MEQKFIRIHSLNLSYLEANSPAEKTIFFIHGNSISSRSWKKQFNSTLLQNYRLIAIDLPAHGDSDASENPDQDYNLPALGAIVAETIKVLTDNKPYLLAGLSLGTNIVAEALTSGLKPVGILLAGSCIIGAKTSIESFAKPNNNIFVVFSEQSKEAEVRKYASEGMLSNDREDIEEFIADYFKVKLPFRSALMKSIQQQNYSDQIAVVQNSDLPLLVIFGQEEIIVNPDYLDDIPLSLWNNKIHKLLGSSHLVNIDQPEQFNQLLSTYAKERFTLQK